jgi:hypothetical protein
MPRTSWPSSVILHRAILNEVLPEWRSYIDLGGARFAERLIDGGASRATAFRFYNYALEILAAESQNIAA